MISVVIPVYNHASTLKSCLLSIVSQKNLDFEIIIVNDGSTDGFEVSMAEVMKDKNISTKIKIVINQENKGAPVARNAGFKYASGEFLIFLDADTICDAEMFDQMLAELTKHPECSYAYSQFQFGFKKFSSRPFDVAALRQNNFIDVTSMIRTKDFPGFDESVKRFQDWDLWLTMFEQNKAGIFVPKVLYKKIVGRRVGISNWLPSFVYKLPWKIKAVRDYEAAKEIILKKHHLN